MSLMLATLFLVGCDGPIALPSSDPIEDEALDPEAGAKLQVREKRVIWQGKEPGPPPPAEAITGSQCDEITDGGPVKGPEPCVTDVISCDQTIIGHTKGGVDYFDTRFWEKKFCWPATENHNSGDERVYRLDLPDGKIMATVTLDTPCADLDMMGIRWEGGGCPTIDHQINQCESMRKNGTRRERINMVSDRESTWFIVVEGVRDEEGAFALTVQCGPWM